MTLVLAFSSKAYAARQRQDNTHTMPTGARVAMDDGFPCDVVLGKDALPYAVTHVLSGDIRQEFEKLKAEFSDAVIVCEEEDAAQTLLDSQNYSDNDSGLTPQGEAFVRTLNVRKGRTCHGAGALFGMALRNSHTLSQSL